MQGKRPRELLPEAQMDYSHINKKEDVKIASNLNIGDVESGSLSACVTSRGPEEYAIAFVKNFLDGLGYTRLILKTDQEPAIMKLAQEVKNKRTHETVLVKGQKYSHQSMGFIENDNGGIEEQVRVSSRPDPMINPAQT